MIRSKLATSAWSGGPYKGLNHGNPDVRVAPFACRSLFFFLLKLEPLPGRRGGSAVGRVLDVDVAVFLDPDLDVVGQPAVAAGVAMFAPDIYPFTIGDLVVFHTRTSFFLRAIRLGSLPS